MGAPKSIPMTYVVLICARNEEKYIERCLSSVASQTIPAKAVVVVDDGSHDETTHRVHEFSERLPLKVLRNPDRGFSAIGTRLMADTYNLGLNYLSSLEWEYLLILGADTSIPPDYVEKLNMVMTYRIGVASGRYPGIVENYAAATGRFIRREVIEKLGGLLPRTNAWESSVTYCAQYMGYETRSFPVSIHNLRPPGQRSRNYIGRGRATRELGYTLPHALIKVLRYVRMGKTYSALQILCGYLIHKPEKPIPKWAQYINESQKESTRQAIRRIIPW